ncbi:hypothetical protein [Candidatus Chromulinivorax destructor]|uniref:Uncharacterized protein n=1 Tax=Candidatus Chromulinivorax destructor TaxID=2066483 RepID=A0A345ZAB5_9BACT|nr:hypothetical protein [Candidatus Chromulinivorax destructor]AXK60232.1 hypothetical protein C0J27_00505 [Candidatus Chromulinivorax destructor]
MKLLLTIALGVALGIAGYVVVNRYLTTHSATVVVQNWQNVQNEYQLEWQQRDQQEPDEYLLQEPDEYLLYA